MKIVERTTLHVSDDTGRIAMLENRTFGTQANDNDTVPSLTRYIYSNHLQSASLELNQLAEIISYEEYHPYGTTSYQAMKASIQAVAKRYRYTGKERDEESGLYYHGARYYIPWLARWTACDPMESKYAGMSPYNYSFNNPVIYHDPSGMEGEEAVERVTLPEVVIEGKAPQEGQQRDKGIPVDAPASLQAYASQRFHRGSEGHERGWYSTGEYVDINKDAMLGMLHVLLQDAEKGVPRLISYTHNSSDTGVFQKIDNAALQFLGKNRNSLSPDFFSLLGSEAGGLINDFNLKYSGVGVAYLTDSPIDYLARGILKGLGKAATRGAAMFAAEVEGGVSSMRALSIASTRQFAISGLESTLKESMTKWESGTAMRIAGSNYEKLLAEKLGSSGSFTMERVEFDGSYNNIWYEAKSGNFWEHTALRNEASLAKAKSKFGSADALAKRRGFTFHVYSENAIPQVFKEYFNKKGITYFENFK